MDAKEILLTVAASALGLTKDEVEAKLEDAEDSNPLTTLLNLHKDKVKKARDENFDNGQKKAKKEERTKYEQEIKEKYELESDKIGLELIDTLLETKTKNADSEDTDEEKSKKKAISWKDIPIEVLKKHPEFIKKEQEVKGVEERVTKEWEIKFQAKEAEDAKKDTFKTVVEWAMPKFKAFDPILPKDQKKADNQVKDLFVKRLEGFNYEVIKDAQDRIVDVLVLKSDGSREQDEHGNSIAFDNLIRNVAEENFEFQVATDRSSSGTTTSTTATGGKLYKGKPPTSPDEYAKLITDPTISVEQRNEIHKDWGEKQSSNV